MISGEIGGQGLSVSETYQQAYAQGYEDGTQYGREDRDSNRLFDFANKKEFQRANHGFDKSLHEREVYWMAFRRGDRVSIQARVVLIKEKRKVKIKDEEGTLEGEGTKSEDVKRVGKSSTLGTLVGVLMRGKKGAKSGAMVGVVAGLAGVLTNRGRDLDVRPQTEMIIELDTSAETPESIVPFKSP